MNRLLVLLLLLPLFVHAQQFMKPDYKAIKEAIRNKQSAYYYPPLYERFKNDDTTLKPDEYRYLYYGAFFNKKRERKNVDSSKRKEIEEIIARTEMKMEYFQKLLRLAKEMLNDDPFDGEVINMVYMSYKITNDSANAARYLFKLKNIAKVIKTSGDGRTDQTGFHVLEVAHEYFMLNVLGYEWDGSQSLTKNNCDYLSVKPNNDNLNGVYFDVKQIFEGYHDMFKGSDKKLSR